jgi:hypothetical protein
MTTASGFHKIIHDSSESHKFFTRYAALIANVDDDNNDAGAPPAAGAGARKRNEERVLLLQLCARRKYAPSLSKSEKIYDRSLVTLDDGADVFVRVLHKLECANEAYRESRTGLLIPSEAWAVYMTINLSSTIDAYALLQQQMSERLIAASRGHPMGVSSPMELFLSAVHTTGGGRFEKLDVDSKEADRVGSLKALFAEHAIKPAFVIESKNGYHVVVDNKRSYGSKTGRKALLAFLETNAAWIHVEDKSTHPSVIVPGTLQGGFPTRLIDDW